MKPSILLSAIAIFVIASCHNQKSDTSQRMLAPLEEKNETVATSDTTTLMQAIDGDKNEKQLTQPAAPPQANPDWDKKIIKTATVEIEVKNLKQYADNIHSLARQFGGYLASEQQSELSGKKELTLEIKVPVAQFESIMLQVSGDSDRLISKKISTEDVTEEYVDTKSRLQTREQMRLKYIDFLKNAKNMKEVLEVQKEINDLQEEIESGAGRINYLSHQSSFSTINITASQIIPGYNPNPETPSFFTRTIVAFKGGFSFIADLMVGLISIWPIILLGIAIWVLVRRNFRKPAKQVG